MTGASFLFQDAGRQFLDEEAELSQQDESCVSSDETEDTDKELSSSLAQFLNDDAEVTQALNGEWCVVGGGRCDSAV